MLFVLDLSVFVTLVDALCTAMGQIMELAAKDCHQFELLDYRVFTKVMFSPRCLYNVLIYLGIPTWGFYKHCNQVNFFKSVLESRHYKYLTKKKDMTQQKIQQYEAELKGLEDLKSI